MRIAIFLLLILVPTLSISAQLLEGEFERTATISSWQGYDCLIDIDFANHCLTPNNS